MTNPPPTPLLDQLRAATREATHATTRTARHLHSPIHHTHPRGAHLTLTLRLARRLLTAATGPCPHLKPHAPQPTYWPAWQPQHLCCRRCLNTANAAIHDTPEQHRCDTCARITDTTHPGLIQTPAIALPHAGIAVGPISLIFGLCGDCQATTGINPDP